MRCETNGKYFLTFTPQESANLILLAWETLLDFYRAQESANRFMCTPGFSVCMYNTANRLVSRLSDRLLNNLSLFCKILWNLKQIKSEADDNFIKSVQGKFPLAKSLQ